MKKLGDVLFAVGIIGISVCLFAIPVIIAIDFHKHGII